MGLKLTPGTPEKRQMLIAVSVMFFLLPLLAGICGYTGFVAGAAYEKSAHSRGLSEFLGFCLTFTLLAWLMGTILAVAAFFNVPTLTRKQQQRPSA